MATKEFGSDNPESRWPSADTDADALLPIGAIAAVRVVTVTLLLIGLVTLGISLLVVEPGQRVISGFVIGGMLTFIGLPFVLAAVQDEIERMHA